MLVGITSLDVSSREEVPSLGLLSSFSPQHNDIVTWYHRMAVRCLQVRRILLTRDLFSGHGTVGSSDTITPIVQHPDESVGGNQREKFISLDSSITQYTVIYLSTLSCTSKCQLS